MKVTVRFTANIRTLTKVDQIVVELDHGAYLRELLHLLVERYGESLASLMFKSGMGPIDTWTSILVDGRVFSLDPVPDIVLNDGSLVVLLAAVSGG
ncbi:MAG: hypothetical protein QG670_84 [Thermoproteota archaeon]|nr:hypothetical protein [Thermoproteota archaeon]